MTTQGTGLSVELFAVPIQALLATALIYTTYNTSNHPQISIKLADPKPSTGMTMQALVWLSTLKRYFIVVGITFISTKAADI